LATKRSITDVDLSGRRVLLRVDFNVPLSGSTIEDDTRIRASLPTIQYALAHAPATLMLASHLGRPKGKPKPEFSLTPVAVRLAELLRRPVVMADDCVGEGARRAVEQAGPGGIVMLENLRFHPGEEKNDEEFAKALAALCDVFINDAFGAAHRAHGSTEAIVRHVPTVAAGFLMAREIEYLTRVLTSPERPFVAVLGGAKVSDKLQVIQNLLGHVDALVIGGAMAYTFLKTRGLPVGRSLVEDDLLEAARTIEAAAAERSVWLELPRDHVVADRIAPDATAQTLLVDDPAIGDRMGLDIGPATAASYAQVIEKARTVVWNGPMGVFEIDAFAAGTNAVARAVASVKGMTVVGGGDSISAVTKAGVADRITHISTGGGASLEFLAGLKLPGVAVLPDKP
jgi:phosphoglycerate kinase